MQNYISNESIRMILCSNNGDCNHLLFLKNRVGFIAYFLPSWLMIKPESPWSFKFKAEVINFLFDRKAFKIICLICITVLLDGYYFIVIIAVLHLSKNIL